MAIQSTAGCKQGWLLCVSTGITGCSKCLATVGPTLGANFCHGFVSLYIYFMHWTHGIETHQHSG